MRRCSESAASPRPRSRHARSATHVAVGLAAVMCGVLASCSGPIDIGGKASDLMVSSPSVSDSGPKAGARFTLSATVRNAGDGAAATTTLRYYRSSDATITRADTEVGTDAIAELAASATSSQSVDLAAPATPGTYHYGACVDAVTDESDTTNNCSASVEVTVPEADLEPEPQRHADLLVTSPSVSDGRPAAGAGFTLSATVRNDGEGAAEATTLRYYRSSDATITRADTEVGTDVVAELAASATSSQSVDLAAPATPGTYHYGACVDAVTDESDTANNCSASVQVTVPEPSHPDLTVTSPSVSDRDPAAGAAFTVSATVRNDGEGAAEATTLRYYRSSDATITTADTEVGTEAIAGLAASGSAGASADLTAPATPGPYYYGACADAVTDESDTTNNCSASVQVTVPAPSHPDLTVMAPSVSDGRPATGARFTLSATVRNDGERAAEATTLRYYRSSDATITTADTEVGKDAIAGLAASGSAGESVELTAPATPGPYYYGACADAVTDESDTTNNCSASVQITVQTTQPTVTEPQGDPDLTVTSPSVSDRAPVAGATFTLSATVRNAGDGAAEATTLRYYRSTDATITTSDLEVGTDAIAGLAALGSAGASVELTAPSTPGPYYYGACADAVTDESDTTNNCSASMQVTVPEPRHPDLTVTSPSVSDRAPVAGATFMLSATVRNAGDGAAEATTLRYYRSTDATITTSDLEVGTDAIAGLAALGSAGASVELTAPSTPGPYYYGACADAVTDESDTTNNCSASVQVTVPAPKPDLVVGSPHGGREQPRRWCGVHAVGDGTERGCWRGGVDDAALLPLDGRDDHGGRHAGGHGRGGQACRFSDQRPVGGADGADDTWTVLLRGVRGRGDGRVGHDEQLLDVGAGDGTGAEAGPGGGIAHGGREQPRRWCGVHAVGDGTERGCWRGGVDDAALLPLDGRDDHGGRHAGGHGRGGQACRFGDQRRVGGADGADDTWAVLLRGVRGRGDRRVGHGEQLLGIGAGDGTGAEAGPGGGIAHGGREQPRDWCDVHAVGDGTERGCWRGGVDDAALLPFDGRDDHDVRHRGGHGRGGQACRFSDQRRVGGADGAVDACAVLLRGVRGRGDRRVGHGEQLLGIGAGDGTGAEAGPGGGIAHGGREQPRDWCDVHAVGDGTERGCWRGGVDDAALLPFDGRDDHDVRHRGGHGRGGQACRFSDQRRVGGSDGVDDTWGRTTTGRAWTR